MIVDMTTEAIVSKVIKSGLLASITTGLGHIGDTYGENVCREVAVTPYVDNLVQLGKEIADDEHDFNYHNEDAMTVVETVQDAIFQNLAAIEYKCIEQQKKGDKSANS